MIAIATLSIASAAAIQLALAAGRRAAVRRRLPAILVALPTRTAPRWLRLAVGRVFRDRRDRQRTAALPDVLDAIARSLRSGASLRQALDEAAGASSGALAADLAAVVRSAGHGVPLADALGEWARSRPLPGVRLAAAALALGAETGGASAQAVDGVAATLRTNLAIDAEIRALSSQARLSAMVIAVAPVGFSLVATTTDARTATFLLRTPLGLACAATGLALDLAGWWWMRRLSVVRV